MRKTPLAVAALIAALAIVCPADAQTQGQPVSDTNSASFQGAVSVSPGTPVSPQRSIGLVCTSSGTVTFTFPDGSTITLTIPASPYFQSLPFAVTLVTLGSMSGTSCTFWNLK